MVHGPMAGSGSLCTWVRPRDHMGGGDPDGRVLAVSHADGGVRLWRRGGEQLSSSRIPLGQPSTFCWCSRSGRQPRPGRQRVAVWRSDRLRAAAAAPQEWHRPVPHGRGRAATRRRPLPPSSALVALLRRRRRGRRCRAGTWRCMGTRSVPPSASCPPSTLAASSRILAVLRPAHALSVVRARAPRLSLLPDGQQQGRARTLLLVPDRAAHARPPRDPRPRPLLHAVRRRRARTALERRSASGARRSRRSKRRWRRSAESGARSAAL